MVRSGLNFNCIMLMCSDSEFCGGGKARTNRSPNMIPTTSGRKMRAMKMVSFGLLVASSAVKKNVHENHLK